MTDETLAPLLSKTRRKQAMEELQTLGEELVGLSADRVKRLAIPDDLREAISEAQRMTRHDEARRRQMQFIGRLMRDVEAEPIRAELARVRGESTEETARLHRLEKLRDALLADEKLLHEIAVRYPAADLQHVRALRRAALKEQHENRPPRSYRAIFQLFKALEEEKTASEVSS